MSCIRQLAEVILVQYMANDKKLSGEFILRPEEPKQPISKAPPVSRTAPDHPHEHKRPNFFTSLCPYPEGVSFENQKEGEEIILLVRRDFITNVPWILTAILMIIVPLAILPLLPFIFPFLNLSAETRLVTTLFYYLIVFGFVLINYSLWYFRVGLVTNERLVDVDVHGILARDVAETKLDLVQDVSYTQVGVIRSIFNYGDIFIQTAGNNANFEFDKAPSPARISQIIGSLIGNDGEPV